MAFQYDLFISYSSEDRAWAEELRDGLRQEAPGLRVFFDRASLRAGDQWEQQIEGALETTQHLLLLWSPKAAASEWVSRERITFLALAKPKENPNRRFLSVNLEGRLAMVAAFQQVDSPEIQSGYAAGVAPASLSWKPAVRTVLEGLDPRRKPLSVPLVILTLSLVELERQGWKNDFELTPEQLRARYGETRDRWRPFCNEATILEVVEGVRRQVNDALTTHAIDWQRPPDEFWTDVGAARAFVAGPFRTGEVSTLIIDPIALSDRDVFQRLMLFQDSLTSQRTVIATLPPYATSRDVLRLRAALTGRAAPYFDDYFRPVFPPRRRLVAHCVWNAADADDLCRHILLAATQLAPPEGERSAAVFVRHG